MGIGCRLRGTETANRANRDAQWALSDRGRAAAADLTERLDGDREVCVADSKHRGARAWLEAVGARNRVGRQDRMVSSGRVEGCAVSRYAGAGWFDSGTTCDDVQGAAFALRSAPAKRRPLLFCQQRAWIRRGSGEMESTQSQRLPAVAVGKQSEVADLDEAGGQDVEQEAADELCRIEGHDAAAVVVPGVPPAEAYMAVIEAE